MNLTFRGVKSLNRLESFYRKRCGLLYGLLALVIVLCVLFGGDDVGLSNNADFGRVINVSSLAYGEKLPSFTYADTYVITLSEGSALKNICSILFNVRSFLQFPSVQVLLVRASVVVNLVINKLTGLTMTTYHIGVLGVIHSLLYAAGIGLLLSQFRLRRLWQDIAVKVAALFVLCDIGYIAYFNSFYGEGPEHIALIYCVAMLVRLFTRKPTFRDAIWCAISAAAYGWAKFFNIPLAVLFLLVMGAVLLLRTGKKITLIPPAAAFALLLFVFCSIPSWMGVETNYNSVFFGILRDVDLATAEEYVADMGLSPELADYRDTNIYLPDVTASLQERGLWEEARSIGKGTLLKFYLTHPGRLFHQAVLSANHSGMIRPYYMANLGEGYPLMTYSNRMSLWGQLRDRLTLDTLAGNLLAVAAFFVAAIAAWRKKMRPLWLALPLVLLLGGLVYAFLMPVILNGEGDFAKHMFAYQEILDLMLLALLALALDTHAGKTDGKLICPVTALLLAAVLVVPPVWNSLANRVEAAASHDAPEVGSYLMLGNYQGEALTWLVTEEENGVFTLLCVNDSIALPFDTAQNNDWRDSSIRSWLNGEFLTSFSEGERALLLTQENPMLLTNSCRKEATAGNLFFPCDHIATLAARTYERCYQVTLSDTVTLPDIDLIARLAQEGYDISGASYWLETAYCPARNLSRYVANDGHIYFGPSDVIRAIRPVIQITLPDSFSGRGSLRNPFLPD